MTLRDAIREMVRYIQMNLSGAMEKWEDRDKFRESISTVSRFIYRHPQMQDSQRVFSAGTAICGLFDSADTDKDRARVDAVWKADTRSVWATL